MLDKVINKISVEQTGKEGTDVWAVGEQLKDICKMLIGAAEIVFQDLDNPEMSIVNAAKKIKEFADERHKKLGGKSVYVSSKEAEEIIKKFYGLDGLSVKNTSSYIILEKSEKKINLEDFI